MYDVVVAGSGAAGLTAALAAARAGCRAAVFGAAPRWGGTSGISGGAVWVPGNLLSGVPDRVEDALAYCLFRAQGLRKAMTSSLSGARCRMCAPRVAELVDLLLRPARHGEPLDLVADLVFPFQVLIVCELLAHPDRWARLAARPEPVPTAVGEFLRHDAPTQQAKRLASHPIGVGGRRLRPGRLLLVLGSANRASRVFADPERLDVGRNPDPQLTLSAGGHHCAGWALARVEGAAVFGRLREADGLDHPNFRAHLKLPVRLGSR